MDPHPQHPFDTDRDDGPQSRHQVRDSLLLMADLRLPGRDAIPVRVRNLSAGGLMAEYAGDLDPGLGVELVVRGIGAVSGRVAWRAAGRIGIAFDRLIDPLLARKPVGGRTRSKRQSIVQPAASRR